jgi:hypothetical protein
VLKLREDVVVDRIKQGLNVIFKIEERGSTISTKLPAFSFLALDKHPSLVTRSFYPC